MTTTFKTISNGWNADPNAPEPSVSVVGSTVTLTFGLNYFLYSQFTEGDQGRIIFTDCGRYRLGSTNEHGWYLGQCRFSKKAPGWGEFYEIVGDLLADYPLIAWQMLAGTRRGSRHFLFYFRDETFECDAAGFELLFLKATERMPTS